MTRAWVPAALLLLSGCAYYNGVYNAERASRSGDRQWARGEYVTAADSYRVAAIHAETMLARFEKSRWRAQALYLAARGAALANDCASARGRLSEYLALPNQPLVRVDRATVAKAFCLIEENKSLPADSLLRPLLGHPDAAVRLPAALFSARVAISLGDPERAQRLLATIPGSAAVWENLNAATGAADYAAAESLLATRAVVGEWRSEVPRHVRTLWAAGRHEGVVAIARSYAQSRAPVNERARLLLLTSDLTASAGDTATARLLAIEARRVGFTIEFEGPVAARLLALRIRGAADVEDVRAALARDSMLARGTPELQRMSLAMLLIEICLRRADRFGTGIFLAAEIARDSLVAPVLAHTLFRQVERDYPESPIAARALGAAAFLVPDSAAVYRARAVAEWPNAGLSAHLRGISPRDSSTLQGEDVALNQSWIVVTNQFAESLKVRKSSDSLRRADSVSAAQRARGRGQ